MLLSYLESHYKVGEPIFATDIQIDGLSEVNKRQQIKKLVDSGKLVRFDNGVYYFPKKTRLKGGTGLAADVVVQHKYIEKNGIHTGFYAGHTLANYLGLSTQVPLKKEIVSNNMSAIVREVSVGGFTYVVRKPLVRITERNYKVLQLLELLKDLNEYADNEPELVRNQLVKYIQNNKINRNEIDQYISSYPLKTYKFIYEMRLDNVFA
jgi:hypothetical protein